VYGRKPVEWDILASWVVANNLWSNNVVWLIQIPRLYNVYRDQVGDLGVGSGHSGVLGGVGAFGVGSGHSGVWGGVSCMQSAPF